MGIFFPHSFVFFLRELAADDSQAWKWPHAASGAHESITKLNTLLTARLQ